MSGHLVLLGAGHVHLPLLHAMARRPWRDAVSKITLVAPHAATLYSGMLPGFVAGHYALGQCVIPLRTLVERAGIEWRMSSAVGLDAEQRRVRLADGSSLVYETLSIDTGAEMSRRAIAGSAEYGIFVRPVERFAALWSALAKRAAERFQCVVVIGGGAAGFELALALRHALGDHGHVSLVSGGVPLLPGSSDGARRRALHTLARRGVPCFDAACSEVRAAQVVLGNGLRLASDATLLAIGASAPEWLRGSGLALDAHGFVATRPTLQSVSHAEVFAAGDVATQLDAPRPKSGVFAVRAGPVLERNLARWLAGKPLTRHRPQRHALALLACGRREVIAAWGPLALQARWLWWWKDRIDRRFVARFR